MNLSNNAKNRCYTEVKRLFILLGVFALCANSFASAKPSTLTATTINIAPCKLDVGWTDWKPFQYLSDENLTAGLTIELLDLVAKEMQCQFTYHQNDWLTSVQLIESGQLDFICSASIAENRHKFAFFSKPYYRELLVLYVRAKDKRRYGDSSLIELFRNHDFKLGKISGANFDSQLTTLQADPQFKDHFIYVNRSNKLYEMLYSGEIDGYFSDPLIVEASIADSSNNVIIESYPLEIKTASMHFMFSKKRTTSTRLQKFNRALVKVLKINKSKFEWFLQE